MHDVLKLEMDPITNLEIYDMLHDNPLVPRQWLLGHRRNAIAKIDPDSLSTRDATILLAAAKATDGIEVFHRM